MARAPTQYSGAPSGRPDERLLVVYGAGHLATLRHFVESSPEYRLVEVGE